MMANKGFSSSRTAIMLVGFFLVALSGSAIASQELRFANGIQANVHSAAEITADPEVAGIDLAFGDRPWFPFAEEQVIQALESMGGFTTDLQVDVYILPAPPAGIASSFARGGAIFLAPGTGEVDPSTVAYITTHEMGHVLTWAFLDGSASRWDSYLDLRGLDPVVNGPAAAHADRSREIIAEDFRYLFGGPLATRNASIENHDLALPDQVFGLGEMLAEFLTERPAPASAARSSAFPNPCNPRTTVALSLPAGALVTADQAQLRVFDVRGALVRTLVGGQLSGDQILVQWDGDTDQGTAVASGHYLYVVRAGDFQAKGSVTLVR